MKIPGMMRDLNERTIVPYKVIRQIGDDFGKENAVFPEKPANYAFATR